MKKSKHSPGPWKQTIDGNIWSAPTPNAALGYIVVKPPDGLNQPPWMHAGANASLICAAPTLYEAARNALKVMPVGPEKDALIDVLLEIEAEK